MTRLFTKYLILAATAVFALAAPLAAETPVGSNIDSRVVLAFKVNDPAAQAWLPGEWKLLTLPNGPFAGANLLVSFIDRHLSLDPDGKPLAPYASRAVALLAYGVQPGADGARMFVTRVYETPPVASSYDNGLPAAIARSFSLDGPADMPRTHAESWAVLPEAGGEIHLDLRYQAGAPGWSSAMATPYSGVNPAFHRIYRYDQLADLAMSKAAGRALNGEIGFAATVPELAPMFDGTEDLVGVLVLPVYVREVSLP